MNFKEHSVVHIRLKITNVVCRTIRNVIRTVTPLIRNPNTKITAFGRIYIKPQLKRENNIIRLFKIIKIHLACLKQIIFTLVKHSLKNVIVLID